MSVVGAQWGRLGVVGCAGVGWASAVLCMGGVELPFYMALVLVCGVWRSHKSDMLKPAN